MIEALAALILSMVLIFVLSVVFKVSIEYALLSGAILMGLLTYPLDSALTRMVSILFDETSLAPIMTAVVVMILINLYDSTGMIVEVQELLRSVLKRPSLIFSVVPAVLGLLPVAGGALLSAPFVDSEGEAVKMEKARRVYLNIWFRHSLIMVYPYTNLFIVTIALTHVSPIGLITTLLPVSAVMFLIGYLLGLRGLRTKVGTESSDKKKFSSLVPLSLALLVGILFLKFMGMWGIFFGALAGISTILLLKLPSRDRVLRAIIDEKVLMVALLLYSAMLFRSYVAGSKIPELVRLAAFMPHPLLEILTSMFFGFFLGHPTAAVAIVFSILAPTMHLPVTTTFLILSSTFLSYMISPFHLCLILTVRYMEEGLVRAYKYLLPSFLLTIAFIISFYVLVLT